MAVEAAFGPRPQLFRSWSIAARAILPMHASTFAGSGAAIDPFRVKTATAYAVPSGKVTTPASLRAMPISPPLLAATVTAAPNPEAIRLRVNCRAIAVRTAAHACGGPARSVQIPCSSITVSVAVVRVPRVGSNTALEIRPRLISSVDGGPARPGSCAASAR